MFVCVLRGRRLVVVGLFGGSLRRGVAEGFDADVLRFGFVPAGGVVAVGPEVEVDLLFVGSGDVVCAADLVQGFAAFRVAYCPGDAIRRPVHADGGAAEVVRPGVAGAHFDGVVGRPVGEKALQIFAAPARDFDGVEFAVVGDGGFYPFVGEEAEDGVGVEVGEVAGDGELVAAVAHRFAGADLGGNRAFAAAVGEVHVEGVAMDLDVVTRPFAAFLWRARRPVGVAREPVHARPFEGFFVEGIGEGQCACGFACGGGGQAVATFQVAEAVGVAGAHADGCLHPLCRAARTNPLDEQHLQHGAAGLRAPAGTACRRPARPCWRSGSAHAARHHL